MLKKKKFSVEEIAEIAEVSVEYVKELVKQTS
jgi:predicted HTH domain antitoxin